MILAITKATPEVIKTKTVAFFFFFLFSAFSFTHLFAQGVSPTKPASNLAFDKIVLDAGHGGSDVGARGRNVYEKNLTLAITLRLGKILADSMKDVQVIYTRTTDVFPTLKDRHRVANDAQADLFISIHINSSPGWTERVKTGTKTVGKGKHRRTVPVYRTIHHPETNANGTETLVLGTIRNNQKRDAMGEYGDQIIDEPGLLDPNDPQTAIILEQYMNAFLSKSVSLGNKIQAEFAAIGRGDRGVHQQSLEVLAGSYMPGVLVECGFINNLDEEAYLMSDAGQQAIAMAIFRAIKAYRAELERK